MKFPPALKGLEGWPLLGLHRRWGSHASPSLAFVPASPPPDPMAVEKLQAFVARCRRLLVLTGAGISTESGIPDYRSEGVGLYARSDRRPVQHAEFLRSAAARQKYWARNFVGWPQFSSHQPNVAHQALSHWEQRGKLHWLVTQNVDALHTKAGSQRMTELHGCTHRFSRAGLPLFPAVDDVGGLPQGGVLPSPISGVLCLSCGARVSRAQLQERFEALNPTWTAEAHGVAPDGDVFLTEEQVCHFRVPSCSKCGGLLKPDVIFFGDNVCKEKVDFVYRRLEESDAVLVAGSSLQVFSAYKYVLAARDRKLPIAIVNIGPTRADSLASLKLSSRCGALLPSVLL